MYGMRCSLCGGNIMRSFITNLFMFLCVLLVFPHSGIANTYDSIEYNLNLSNIKNLVLTVEMTLKGKFEDKIVLTWTSLYADRDHAEQFKHIEIFPEYKIDFIRKNDDVRAIITVPNPSKDPIKIMYEVH